MLKKLRWSQDFSRYVVLNILEHISADENNEVIKGSVDQEVDETAIFLSIEQNDLTTLYQLVQHCQSLDMRNKSGETLLSFSIKKGNYLATSLF